MAEEILDNVIEENAADNQTDTPDDNKEVTFTPEQQAKIDEIIQREKAKEKRKADEAVKAAQESAKEAEKLAKMNKDQKTAYELEQAQKKLAEYEEKEALNEMRKQAREMLTTDGINVSEAMLDIIVTPKADSTKSNVEAFSTLFKDEVKKQVQEKLRQDTPRNYTATGMSKEDILNIKDATKRQNAIAQNLHLFN